MNLVKYTQQYEVWYLMEWEMHYFYFPEDRFEKFKEALNSNTFVNLWGDLIPRKNIEFVRKHKAKSEIADDIATLPKEVREKVIQKNSEFKKLNGKWYKNYEHYLVYREKYLKEANYE